MNQTMQQGRLAIFRINYKSDFIITLNSDAGWMTPFCIKFWTGAPSQAYFAGWDGTTYTNCAPVQGDPTKLKVQFDDHHLPIGELKYQIGYHFTIADFPTTVEDEVLNQERVVINHDGQDEKVLLDFNGETAPDIQFSLPAYANEAQRIANEEQRIAHEAIRIVNEEGRIAAEQTRQQNEEQRIAQETARVQEFARLKRESESATSDATAAATLANTKAQLAADKAALAQSAADLANAKAQLAADKAALAASAAQLANDKAALAQQKAEYAQTQGTYAKNQGDYAKQQGDYAKDQGDTALADHLRAEADHETAASDHTRAESDHSTASSDHTQASTDHSTATSDHSTAAADHTQAGTDHTRAESDHSTAASDHTTAGNDHTRAESDHTRAESDHAAVEVYVDSLGVFDLSKHNAVGGVLATYADLSAALTALNALESKYKYGGMSFKFVQTSDNKYVQFRCKTQSFSANSEDWAVCDDNVYVGTPNPEWIKVVIDADRRILGGIKRDGSIEWYKGVPASVKAYVDGAISAIMSGTSGTDIDGISKIITFLDDFSTSDTLKSLLDEKVDVEEGKSLIPDQFVEQSENPEFIQVLMDADRRMIESTTPNGKKIFYGDVEIKGKDVLEEIDKKVNEENGKSLIPTQFIQEIESPEYIECHTDNNRRMLYGVDKDGNFVFGNGIPKQIQKSILDIATDVAGRTAKNNILYRRRYTNVSGNLEEVIDVSDRYFLDYVYIGVFASDYLYFNSKKYDVLKSLDGNSYTSVSTNYDCNKIYRLSVETNIKYLKIVTTNITSEDTLNISFNSWSNYNGNDISVAANDSNLAFKRAAHFICDGVNDEVELDEACILSSWTANIYLGNGSFYIDSFIPKEVDNEVLYGVITLFRFGSFSVQKRIIGIEKSTNSYGQGTRIYVRESAFTNLPVNTEPYVISGPTYGSTSTAFVENLAIMVENNQHKIVCINGQHLGALTVERVILSAGANAWSETLPVEGCVGLRGVMGDCNGTNYYISHTYAGAFYEGFQLGGEHLVMIECGGRFNYYCYTFGNYDYGSAYNSGAVTDSHPLTLINCCDEGSRALPKFVKSGMYNDGNVAAKQQIDLIGFNMEVHTASLQGAVEVTPGAFCGTVDFVAYGASNTSKNTPGPERRNRVDIKFWASDNDGKYFRTTNAAHSEQGSSSERLGYWAQKMQKYYDTDLNKMLVCTNEANQTWRDCNGNIIND